MEVSAIMLIRGKHARLLIAVVSILGWGNVAYFARTAVAAQRSDGQLTLEVVDSQTKQPVAARLHLKNARGRPVSLRLPNTAEFGGHLYVDGRITLPLRVGQYTFELDVGPDYLPLSGHFEIERHADDTKQLEVKRFVDLEKEKWYAGDLDVARRAADLPLIMRAEGLRIAPTRGADALSRTRPPSTRAERGQSQVPRKTTDPGDDPAARLMQGSGGDLLLCRLQPPRDAAKVSDALTAAQSSASAELLTAIDPNEHVVARVPYAWNLPVWLASGKLDAIQLIHHHALREAALDNEQDGRPRDAIMYPGRRGNGRWSEAAYYHVLNCGLRVAPAAGSGSGTNDNPVGTNRVYVHCADDFSPASWWDGLEAGRVFVTNGPLLRPTVEGQPPGYVFRMDRGGSLSLEIGCNLATRVPVDYLQIIKNGEVEIEVRLADWVKKKGRLPPIHFDSSGWFLVRAVTNNEQIYQFAASGPYYVEQARRPRISRRSVTFFLQWIDAAANRIRELPALSDAERAALLAEHELARQFFQGLLAQANAD